MLLRKESECECEYMEVGCRRHSLLLSSSASFGRRVRAEKAAREKPRLSSSSFLCWTVMYLKH